MKTRVTIRADFEIEIPSVPNFIKTGNGTIDIKDIGTESLVKIADCWKQALIQHAADRNKNQPLK